MASLLQGADPAQKIEIVDGVKIIQNEKGGKFGRELPLALEFVRKIGDIDTEDENLAFNLPEDLAVDQAGNIYVLDSGNHRIQKFSPELRYLTTFGRRGQGPAEFNYPQRLDLDSEGNIYVLDRFQARIQILDSMGRETQTVPTDIKFQDMRLLKPGLLAVNTSLGYDYDSKRIKKEGLPKIVKLIDLKGGIQTEFVEASDYGGPQINDQANYTRLATDKDGYIYLTFSIRNRVDKYAPDGRPIWSATRKLNFSDEIELKGKTRGSDAAIPSEIIFSSTCSMGIAADEKGRVWVVTPNRQMKKDEWAGTMGGYNKGGNVTYLKIVGDKAFLELRETDIYKLEVFDADGILLGEIPLTHFADRIIIHKDNLFIMDQAHASTFYQYRIVEK
jgi:DNA-binding beta-propeller fold protein YncE